jgi:aspartate-semialdehyde dehydrogenase
VTGAGALRIGVLGATGALGGEVLALLADSPLGVAELVPVATDRSLGQQLEFRGVEYPVESELPPVRGLDVVFLCAPAGASLEAARQALMASVPCIDVAGALAGSPEVALRVAGDDPPAALAGEPLLVGPPGAALPWALVLRPLDAAAGLRRVVGTALEAASRGGRTGIETLYSETLAILNQGEPPPPDVFGRPVAFDCVPAGAGAEESAGDSVAAALRRLVRPDLRIALSVVQVPAFVGFGASAALEFERPIDPKQAGEILAGAPGVERWPGEPGALTLRAAAGRDTVLVNPPRCDGSVPHGLLLWFAADVLRLAASNALRLALARLVRPH